MSDKIDAVIASMGWDLDQQEWADIRRLCEAALAQQPTPTVPDGWKLVPAEPTKEMIVAGKEAHWEADNAAASGNDGFAQFGMRVKRAAHVYRAMLAAAPAAPVAHVSQESFSSNGTSDIITQNLPIGIALYTAPPAAEQPDTVKVPRELLAEAESIIDSYAESLKACHAPGGDWEGEEAAHDDYEREAGVAAKLRALLAGGEA